MATAWSSCPPACRCPGHGTPHRPGLESRPDPAASPAPDTDGGAEGGAVDAPVSAERRALGRALLARADEVGRMVDEQFAVDLRGNAYVTARLGTELIGRWLTTDVAASDEDEAILAQQGEQAILEDAVLASVAKAYFAWRDITIAVLQGGGLPAGRERAPARPGHQCGAVQLRRQPGPHHPPVRRHPPLPPAAARRRAGPPGPPGPARPAHRTAQSGPAGRPAPPGGRRRWNDGAPVRSCSIWTSTTSRPSTTGSAIRPATCSW